MTVISVSIDVECPVEDVFAFVTDARNNPLWQTSGGLKSTRQLPETPVGVGTRITEEWQFMGRRTESTSEVTEYQPAKKYVRRSLDNVSPIQQGDCTFEPLAAGTKWTFTAEVKANGVFAIAVPLVATAIKKGMETNMAEAKALLERTHVHAPHLS